LKTKSKRQHLKKVGFRGNSYERLAKEYFERNKKQNQYLFYIFYISFCRESVLSLGGGGGRMMIRSVKMRNFEFHGVVKVNSLIEKLDQEVERLLKLQCADPSSSARDYKIAILIEKIANLQQEGIQDE
jgi:hypothetical protein